MSKFEEMCEALRDGQRKWIEYQDRSFQKMSALVGGFIAYCEIPSGRVSYINLEKGKEELKSGMKYNR